MASERLQRQIERLLDEAEEAISKFDWDALLQRTQAVLVMDPENRDALAFLATAERAIGAAAALPSSQPSTSIPNTAPAATTDQPTSFANGRYQVTRFLGEGGKKQVYSAQDTLLDRGVAFALIKTEGSDAVSRTRITREAQAMGRLGSHPHIVPVFDLGEHEGQPYMVTKLMGGGDVERVIEDAPDHRLSLEQAFDIARETCRGLEFAHSRGIVHRDLKPGNVWLTGDGTAKIGDFGLAVAIDRSRLTTEGMMVGTVSDMPPEQAMGGEVTPRADLYSLGSMLYEMVTGRPPFLGDDSVAIIGQHINTPPVAPTWHNSECPRALEALILRLLAKNPSERPDSAADVLAALDNIDPTVSAETARPVEEAHALDSLAGGVFVGRQREMGELKAALEDALSGRGRLITLVGEPGIGKTRTAQELATYAGMRSAQVLWGRCYDEQGMPPYWPWVQAIRSYVREREPDQLRSEMGAGAADIAEVVSDVRERLPDLNPPPQFGSPEQARFRLFDSITSFLKTASQRQPLVLVLDDLHWADQPSLLLLQFVARELGNSRLLLMGTYRDVELNRQHPLAETLAELTRERLFQRVLLRGFGQQDVARFIEVVAGVDPPSGLAEAVHGQTEGNPLFVTEVVRLLVQEGELNQESVAKDSWTVRIPEGVREVIGRRLNRLSQRCNETLTIASVIGREFELGQLTPLIEDISEDRLLEVLEEALSDRVIEELPQAVGRYQFTHALIQETLTEELTLTRRVRLHARIAEALEALYGDNAETHAAELAHHFAQAEAVAGSNKLVHYSLLAGERALAAYAWEEAQAHLERALAAKGVSAEGTHPASDAETAAMLFGLARAQMAMAQRHEMLKAADSLSRAFNYYADAGDVERAVEVAGYRYLPASDQSLGVAQLIVRALELVSSESHQAGRLLARYGHLLGIEEGDYVGAQEAVAGALSIAEREHDTILEMETLANAARVDRFNLDFQGALRKSLRAIESARQYDDLFVEVAARYEASFAYADIGELEQARQHAVSMLELAEPLRDRYWLSSALNRNQALYYLTGDWLAAREFSNRGLAVVPGDYRNLSGRAIQEYQVGDFDQGSLYLERLLEVMRRTPPGPSVADAFPALVIALIARITGLTDRLEGTEAAAQAVLSSPSVNPVVAQMAVSGLALLAVARKDVAAAQQQYDSLQHGATVTPALIATIDGLLGLLAQTMGNPTTVRWSISRTAWHSAARRPTGPNWPGPAATTPIHCSNVITQAIMGRPRPYLTSPWPSPASWACGP